MKNGFKIYFRACTVLFGMVLNAFTFRVVNEIVLD
ncbi:DUF6747 family protein [Arenibacter arenosicollis]